jgi:hypothetical protein
MIPATLLYALVMITNGQMTVKTGYAKEECLRAASYYPGNTCIRLANGTGTTLVYKSITGQLIGMNFNGNPATCQKFLESTSLPAACIPLPMLNQGCLS